MSTMTADHPQTASHPHVHNVEGGREYRTGTGKVLRHGDRFKVAHKGTYKVIDVFVEGGQVYVTGYGGKTNHLATRTFHVDRCEKIRKGEDPLEPEREALRDVSNMSKKGKRPQ